VRIKPIVKMPVGMEAACAVFQILPDVLIDHASRRRKLGGQDVSKKTSEKASRNGVKAGLGRQSQW